MELSDSDVGLAPLSDADVGLPATERPPLPRNTPFVFNPETAPAPVFSNTPEGGISASARTASVLRPKISSALGVSTLSGGTPQKIQPDTLLGEDFGHDLLQNASRPAVAIPKFTVNKDDSVPLATGKEVVNILTGLPEFFESPLGIATAAGGGVAPKAVTALFTADMLHNLGSQTLSTYRNWDKLTPPEKASAIVDMTGSGVMAGLLAGGFAHEFSKSTEKPSQSSTANAQPAPAESPTQAQASDADVGLQPEQSTPQNYAGNIASPAQVPELEVRPPVGQEAPLRQQRETASAPPLETETPPAQQSKVPVNALNPDDLRPALLVDGKPVTGGDTHAQIMQNAIASAKTDAEKAGLYEAQLDDSKHVFVDNDGKVYSRTDAAQALGQTIPLQSEQLLKLKEAQTPALPERAKSGTMSDMSATPSTPPVKAVAQPASKESGVVDTIAGRMSLTEFEKKGYAPEQVTKQNWIDLQRAERRRLGQNEGGDSPNAPNAEYEEFHKQAVTEAVKRGEEVDPEVLADYPELKRIVPPEPAANLGAGLPEGKGSTPEQVRALVQNELTFGLPVNIVSKAEAVRATGVPEAAGYGGFFHDGEVYLVHDNIAPDNPEGVRQLLREEVAHGLLRTAEGQKQLAAVLEKGKLNLTDAEKAPLLASGYREHQLLDEFIAKSAAENRSWWQEALLTVKDWLSKVGLQLSNEDVARLLVRQLKRGASDVEASANNLPATAPGQPVPPKNASTTDQGNWVETIVSGVKTFVSGKVGTFDAQSTAASVAHAKSVFDKLNIPVTQETRPDPRQGNKPITFWRLADFGKADSDGLKLIDEIKSQIEATERGQVAPDLITNLIASVRANFEEGTMEMFSPPIQQQLFNLSQGYVSWHASILGSFAQHAPNLLQVMKNVPVWLGRARYDSFGGDAYDSFFARILERFRSFFTPDEIDTALKEFPELKATFDRIIAQNHADYGGIVYRKVQAQWKEKFAPTLKKLENDARINEAAQAIIEEAKKRFGIEPKPAIKKTLSPYEQLLHLANEQNAAKVAKLMEGAVADAEYNAGVRAMEDAVKTEPDAAKKQALIDHLTLMAADDKIQPPPEYVEKGLTLPEYANWKAVRDNWFDYSPATMRLVQQVLRGDFRGLRFKDPETKPADTRIDLNALAKSPETEVSRVLDAYYKNVDEALNVNNATDAARLNIGDMIRTEMTKQLESARERARDTMFRDKVERKAPLTPQERALQLVNAKLFADPRLDLPEMVQRVASKSAMQRLTPNLNALIQKVFETPAFRQDDVGNDFAAKMIDRLGISDDQAANAQKVFNEAFRSRMVAARARALKIARESLSPREKVVFANNNPFWAKVEKAVNAGILDSSELIKEVAAENGWKEPTRQQVERIKGYVEAEQRLRTLSKQRESQVRLSMPNASEAEIDAALERARAEQEAATYEQRSDYIRKLGVEWTNMTRPINLLKYFSSKYRRNNAQALNEYETLDMLMKVGFGIFRLPTHITTQLLLHTPTRAIGRALTIRDNEILKNPSARRRLALDTQFWKDVHSALSDSIQATMNAVKPAILSARAELLGRGESRNVDRLMSGINAMERLAAMTRREADAGRWWNAAILHFINMPRVVQWYVSAVDHFQGKPVEYQELIHQIEIRMREDGKNHAEIATRKQEVFDAMKSEFPVAVADTRAMFDEMGISASQQQIEEAAQNLVRRRIFDMVNRMGLPADAFEQDINILRSTVSWQESTTRGLGGVVAGSMRGLAGLGEEVGIPTSMTRLSNAIGTGLNYTLMNTPLYKLADIKTPFSRGEEHSTWFRTDLDRNHRMVQAIVGSSLGAAAIALTAAGLATVNTIGPLDKKERDMWTRAGHKPGTVEFNLPDGSFIPISMTVGPISLVAPYFSGGGAVHDLFAKREKEQQKLNEEAAKLGVEPGKIAPISSLDVLAVAGQAMMGTLMSSRTASGLTASAMEGGVPNAQKLAAAFITPLVPGLPAYQEISRMMGVQMNPKLASVFDYLVPLPTSPNRAINVLGEPVETPNDVQRVIQVITAGSYPLPVSKESEVSNDTKAQAAYAAMFDTGYRPPTINPTKGYDVNGTYRPLNASELQAYTVSRGQNLKDALAALGPNPTKQQVQAAYQDANSRALASVGVTARQHQASTARQHGASHATSHRGGAGARLAHPRVHLNRTGLRHRRPTRSVSVLRSHHRHALL